MRIFNLPDRRRPVPSVQALNRWLSDAERDIKVTAKRLGWLVASTVVVAALQRALGGRELAQVSTYCPL